MKRSPEPWTSLSASVENEPDSEEFIRRYLQLRSLDGALEVVRRFDPDDSRRDSSYRRSTFEFDRSERWRAS